MKQQYISRLFSAIIALLLLAGCATAPLDYPREHSVAFTDTTDTYLGREVAEWTAEHPGKSGFYPLIGGLDAFGMRLALIDRAERTIDAQYFLMKPDSAGRLFADKLLDAADRGVRVRILLDDIFTTVNDDAFLVMNQHPNIEIRLFNPIGRGGVYAFSYLGNFKLTNRRMHNKSFTVDNQASVVGGRNIADEYFELLDDEEFKDFDMLAIGPVAADISITFDRFWNHKLAVPMEALERNKQLPDLESARASMAKKAEAAGNSIYARALSSPLMLDLVGDRVEFYPAENRVITDDPEKLLNKVSIDHQELITVLASVVNQAESEVVVITPYFIPGKSGVDFWRKIVNKGVRVAIITNSLASNNHVPVHGGYARYRHAMIDAGVEIYEARVDASKASEDDEGSGYDTMTLHTKAVLIDRRYTFVGSLNLDPRSIDINTEFGVLVDNKELGGLLAEGFFKNLPSFAYRVTENERGKLIWTTMIDGVPVVESKEPQTSWWLRFKAFVMRIAPEGQL
ncbi:MAG: phospholipase D family protein [Proteobacteria bacterium]|nr:phospholipase D family protein [Pseudomonadota bacterium]